MIGVAHRLIAPGNVAGGIGRQFVVRIDVEEEPALGRTLCGGARIQCIDAGVLELDQCRKLAVGSGLGEVAMGFGAEGIHNEHVQLNSGNIGFDRRKFGVDRDLRLSG